MTEIRVFLVDDHPIVLCGIKALIGAAPEFAVVGEAVSSFAALSDIKKTRPDIVVMDIAMRDLHGIKLVARISAENPGVKILILTAHDDRAYVQDSLRGGARGYLLKRSAVEDLITAIRAISAGGLYVDAVIAEKVLRLDAERGGGSGELSERELEVLRMSACGLSHKEAAARLAISIKTVETYKSRAIEKLGLRSRAEILRYGVGQGWLEAA